MAAFSQAVFVILLLLVEAHEYRLTTVLHVGEDLILDVHHEVPEDYSVVEWQFNNMVYLVRLSPGEEPEVSPEYSGRIEFPGGRFSLKLKNLQPSDSGVYTARVMLPVGFQQGAEYEVIVRENRQAFVTQEGEDLYLNVDSEVPEDNSVVEWQFNNMVYLVRFSPGEEPKVSPEYSGRIEIPGGRFSVELKNLQPSDSGVYTARVMLPVGFQQRAEYKVTVRESRVTAVQEGDDLILEVEFLKEGDYVYWRFNDTVDIVRFSRVTKPEVSPEYSGRIEFPGNGFSVKLKNLQLADSGVYTAGDYMNKYKVTVQALVSPVKLSVVSRSSASCNLSVSCSTTRDSHVISSTFTCADGACGQEGGGRLYLLNGSIVCHHSNHASEVIGHAYSQVAPSAGTPVYLVKIVVFSVGLIVMVSAVIVVHLKEKLRKYR